MANALEQLEALKQTYWAEYPGGWEEGFREALKAAGRDRKKGTIDSIVSRARQVLKALEGVDDGVGLDAFLGSIPYEQRRADLRAAWRRLAYWLDLSTELEVAHPRNGPEIAGVSAVAEELLLIVESVPHMTARFLTWVPWASIAFHENGRVAFPYSPSREQAEFTKAHNIAAWWLTGEAADAVRKIRRWGYPHREPSEHEPFLPRRPVPIGGEGIESLSENVIRATLRDARGLREARARAQKATKPTRWTSESNPLMKYAETLKYRMADGEEVTSRQRHQGRLVGDYVVEASRRRDPPVTHTLPDGEPIAAKPGEPYAVYWERRVEWLLRNKPDHNDLRLPGGEEVVARVRQKVSGGPSGGGGPMSSSSSGEVKPNVSGSVGETLGAAGLNGASGGENTGTILPSTGTIATGVPAEKGDGGAMPPVLVWGDTPAASDTASASGTSPAPSGSEEDWGPPVTPPVGK